MVDPNPSRVTELCSEACGWRGALAVWSASVSSVCGPSVPPLKPARVWHSAFLPSCNRAATHRTRARMRAQQSECTVCVAQCMVHAASHGIMLGA